MILELFAISVAVLISVPLVLVGSECLVTLLFDNSLTPIADAPTSPVSYKILIPAHNEAAIVGKTLTNLIAALADSSPENIILVADNCTDNTASIARSFGVTVLERHDATLRGKGFALEHGVKYLSLNSPPDVLVVMDADCQTTKHSLNVLVNRVVESGKPAQMAYIMRVIKNASIKQKIAGFAWLLKNKIRPIAIESIGLPGALSGTGMALPWQALESVKIGHDDIVENMLLSIDCAINGFTPVFCADAVVYSDFPEQSAAEDTQRTRWEHGHLQTILQQLPVVIKESWRQKDWRLFVMALDIGVPPLSLLVVISLCGLMGLFLLLLLAETGTAFQLLLLSFFYFAAMLTCVWWRYGQEYLSAKELSGIPQYVASKLSIYFTFIFKRQKEWVRTERDS